MQDPLPDLEPVRRLSGLLRDQPGLLVERWERLVLADLPPPAPPRIATPALRRHLPVLIDRVAARLGRAGSAEQDTEDPWPAAAEGSQMPEDLPAALGGLAQVRAALLDLAAAEGVRLGAQALRVVHAAIDEAITAVAGALALGAVAAVERERERLELALRLLPVGVFVCDAGGRFLTINDAAMRLWGEQAPLAQSTADFDVYRAYRPGTNEPMGPGEWALVRALRGEAPPADEDVEIVTFDGDRRTIVNSVRALRAPDGTITGGVAVNVDVTDRKRTEQRLAAILDGALDAIVLIDASGRITELNPAAERTFGYPRAEALGRELAELVIEPGLREAHRRGLRRYLATGESKIVNRRVEMRAMHADGSLFDTELTVIRLPVGSPATFAGFIRDITDRKRAELERAREAEFRERFIGMLGHDLRTPLTAIAFSAQSLLQQAEPADAQLRGLSRIVKSAGRMERMIRDLLDFARTRQGGGIPVTPEAGDLAAICRHVIDEAELTHPGRTVALRSHGSAAGRWDPDRIAQVVQNLVVNALDYSPAGAPVQVAIDDAGGHVALAVHNEGPPIPEEVLPDIFNPFRRGAHTEGRAPRGLGLGLYIACEIVRAHGGHVRVESDPAAGTTFVVDLPRVPARAA